MTDASLEPPCNVLISGYSRAQTDDRMDLIYEVSKKVGSVSRMTQLLEKIIRMTQKTLNASAASVLLFDDKDNELYFEVASGPVGKALKRVKVSTEYGIAGQVTRTGKPLIVNDARRHPNFHGHIDKITGFVTMSLICAPLLIHRKVLGVIEVLNKLDGSDFNEQDLEAVVAVAATTAMAIENTQLHQDVLDSYKATVSTLAAAIDAKDPYTYGHSQRVMEYAMMGGKALSLPVESMETLEYAGMLHDVGKISIDAHILNKPGVLNPDEWDIIRQHPVTGAKLLKEIPFLKEASEYVLYHHERFDGTGYPIGKKGQDIPIESRLIAVADAFDTMTTDRSYRPAMSFEEGINELFSCSGTQFCPTSVEAIVSSLTLSNKVR
jgi:HD-GYP domain-containing protein (c-di-GMP phosphodiesterase class II)